MSLLTYHGVVVNVQTNPRPRWTHARQQPIRLHGGDVARDDGYRGLYNGSFVAGPFVEDEQQTWIAFLDGSGETWMFAGASEVGSRGSVPNAGGSYTLDDADGAFNGRSTVASGSFMELPSDIAPADGWCVRCWRDEGSGFEHFVVWGTGTTMDAAEVRASVDGGAEVQASSLGIDNWLSVASDGDVRFLGVTAAGVNGAVDYSECELRAYDVFEEIASGLSGQTVECYPLPSFRVGGESLGSATAGGSRTIKASVFASAHDIQRISGDQQAFVNIEVMQRRT